MRTRLSALALAAVVAVLPAAGIGADQVLLDGAFSPDADIAASLDGLDPSRVFPDPLIAGDFVQYEEYLPAGRFGYLDGLAELETRYGAESDHPVITVDEICDLVCAGLTAEELDHLETMGALVGGTEAPTAITSAGGRSMPVVTLTAPDSPDNPVEERVDLYFSMSIHGNERAGLEGSLRYIEDLAIAYATELEGGEAKVLRGGADTPENLDYEEYTVAEVMERARLVFVDLNPDGWADGDRLNLGLYKRTNDNGIDLNRQWPTIGYHFSDNPGNPADDRYATGYQPEALAGRALIEDHLGTPEGAADLHGENNDNVLLAIMFPAGEFDQIQLQGQFRLAEAIKHNVNTSVFPGLNGLLTEVIDSPVYPAEYHTAYDAIGYDDSGFQGDYLVQQGILEMDHEYAFSNVAPSSVFVPALEQVHVDTTRALLDATIAVTLAAYDEDGIRYTADLGDRTVGYLVDEEVISSDDVIAEPRHGLPQVPYASTSMDWFTDLAPYVDEGSSIVPIAIEELTGDEAIDLTTLDTIVVTDDTLRDATVEWDVLSAWAEAGGTLVLTDEAVAGLEAMGLVPDGAVTRITQYAGSVEDIDTDDPLLTGVGGVIGQTYFEVPLGYRMGTAPAWVVDADTWTGSVAATADGAPALGSMDVGEGKVTIFGAILPDASNDGPNTHGLASYAVTYAGNSILLNALRGL